MAEQFQLAIEKFGRRIRNPKSLFDHVGPFFEATADARAALSDRVEISFIHSELMAYIETLLPVEKIQQFDRIHLSNIP